MEVMDLTTRINAVFGEANIKGGTFILLLDDIHFEQFYLEFADKISYTSPLMENNLDKIRTFWCNGINFTRASANKMPLYYDQSTFLEE